MHTAPRVLLKALALSSVVLTLTSDVAANPYWSYGPGPARASDWVLITVGWASVAPLREDGTTWDPVGAPANPRRSNVERIADALGLAASAFGVALPALSFLVDAEPDPNDPPTHPDVRLDITWQGTRREHLVSRTSPDTLSPRLDYSFLVRASTLSGEGVRIVVEDVDDGQVPAVIGETLLTRAALMTVARGEAIERRDRELLELRLVAEAVFDPARIGAADLLLPLERGLVDSGLEVPGGAIVTVSSDGGGRVSARRVFGCPGAVTPRGVAGEKCQRRNLQHVALSHTPHGGAVVLVGREPSVDAYSLASFDARAAPCIRFVMSQTGRVVVGVNDTDLIDNSGSFGFNVEYRYPTTGEDVEALRAPTPCRDADRR